MTVYELNDEEMDMLLHYLDKLAIHSKYDPDLDIAKDRGEVRTLSYGRKQLPYKVFRGNGCPFPFLFFVKENNRETDDNVAKERRRKNEKNKCIV